MTGARLAESTDYADMYNILIGKKRIASQIQQDYPKFDMFTNKLQQDNVVSFVYELEDNIVGFLISYSLPELPMWVLRLHVFKTLNNFYNPIKNGMKDLYDFVITYWEAQGLTSFIYLQPVNHTKSQNVSLRNSSQLLKTYTSFDLYKIKKNKCINYTLVEKIAGTNFFQTDMSLRLHFKTNTSWNVNITKID